MCLYDGQWVNLHGLNSQIQVVEMRVSEFLTDKYGRSPPKVALKQVKQKMAEQTANGFRK